MHWFSMNIFSLTVAVEYNLIFLFKKKQFTKAISDDISAHDVVS